jgi:hypothetical protein
MLVHPGDQLLRSPGKEAAEEALSIELWNTSILWR